MEAALLTNELQKDSKYPLLFAADFERGLSMRLSGATDFPAAMAFGAPETKNLLASSAASRPMESRAIGIQWNWFPVAGRRIPIPPIPSSIHALSAQTRHR